MQSLIQDLRYGTRMLLNGIDAAWGPVAAAPNELEGNGQSRR